MYTLQRLQKQNRIRPTSVVHTFVSTIKMVEDKSQYSNKPGSSANEPQYSDFLQAMTLAGLFFPARCTISKLPQRLKPLANKRQSLSPYGALSVEAIGASEPNDVCLKKGRLTDAQNVASYFGREVRSLTCQ